MPCPLFRVKAQPKEGNNPTRQQNNMKTISNCESKGVYNKGKWYLSVKGKSPFYYSRVTRQIHSVLKIYKIFRLDDFEFSITWFNLNSTASLHWLCFMAPRQILLWKLWIARPGPEELIVNKGKSTDKTEHENSIVYCFWCENSNYRKVSRW